MGKIVAYVRATGIYDDSRATKEIMALADFVEHVYVLSWDRNGCAEEKCKEVFQKYNNISLYFFKAEIIGSSIGIKNIDKLIRWNRWVQRILCSLQKIDAVHACNLDSGIGAYRYCRKKKAKLVYDIYDYYIDSHNIPEALQGIVEREEIKIINYADVTVICTEERREQISKANPKKIVVIHNSPNVEEFDDGQEIYDYVYCGTLGGGRLIAEILNQYDFHSDLKFVFAGYGANATIAEELAAKYDNFFFEGSIPYSRVIELEKKAMAISAIYKPDVRNHRLCAPNKFYEALALSKPVIVCKGTGIDKIVEENNCGMTIDYDAEQFYDALQTFKNNGNLTTNMGKNGRSVYDNRYKWSVMREILIKCYKELFKTT